MNTLLQKNQMYTTKLRTNDHCLVTSLSGVHVMNTPISIFWLSNAAIGERVSSMIRIRAKILPET